MAIWNVGEKNGLWKGGRTVASNGYVLVRVGVEHHLSDVRGYAYEHRIVAEKKIGRRLRKGEQVHHVNGNKQDNREENIDVMASKRHHEARHRHAGSSLRLPGERNPLIVCGCGCGTKFRRFDAAGRRRWYVSGHNASRDVKGRWCRYANGDPVDR